MNRDLCFSYGRLQSGKCGGLAEITGFQGPGLTTRQPKRGLDSGGNGEVYGESAAAEPPPAGGQTVRGLQGSGRLGQSAARFRGEEDFFEARSQRADAADHRVHPFAHGPVGVVVEGVHADVTEAVLLGVAVPTLPHRGGPVFDRVEPRWVMLLQKKTISEIGPAETGQDRAEQRSSQEAGRQVVVSAGDLLH